ncbi:MULTISPECIES: hypothetical protein [unclassified Pseudomonas]|uniref:hypothetical protein n=1 Tax=unclassified Pseudomonas TaxID=196821 RepID=UPI0028937657|nr:MULTISPECIES: hypothetical protein [unclassified Pseudomonas]
MTTEIVKREPQVAIVPLNAIDIQDVASSAATFDAWLQSASGGRLKDQKWKRFFLD